MFIKVYVVFEEAITICNYLIDFPILGQLLLLVLNEHRIRFLKIVDFKIQSVYHTLEFGDVGLSLMDPDRGFFDGLGSRIQLLVKLISPVDKCSSLIIKD